MMYGFGGAASKPPIPKFSDNFATHHENPAAPVKFFSGHHPYVMIRLVRKTGKYAYEKKEMSIAKIARQQGICRASMPRKRIGTGRSVCQDVNLSWRHLPKQWTPGLWTQSS